VNPPAPPGTSAVPGFIPPATPPAGTTPPAAAQPQAITGAPPTMPPSVTPTVPPAVSPATPPAGGTTTGGAAPAPVTSPATAGGPPNPAPTAAQIIVTPPGAEFRVAGGPYTVPISINNASRVSVLTLTVTYNPAVLRVRTVQDGTFMRQGGVTAAFTPRPDAAAGRVDIAIARTGDQTGASGAGLLAALLFDAIAPGTTAITVTGVANGPDGAPVQLTFAPVTVTVR
jgi:Cohesin domain